MIKSINVNDRTANFSNFTDEEINEAYENIKKACVKDFYLNENKKIDKKKIRKIFKTYFNINNPMLDINAPIPGMDWTPLMLSCWFGARESAEILIKLGADSSKLFFSKKENKEIINALHMAIINKEEELAIYLIKQNPKIVNIKTNKGQTPLMLACEVSLVKLIEELLRFDVSLKEKDNNGNDFEYYCLKAEENFIDIADLRKANKIISYHMLNKELKINPIVKRKVVKL